MDDCVTADDNVLSTEIPTTDEDIVAEVKHGCSGDSETDGENEEESTACLLYTSRCV